MQNNYKHKDWEGHRQVKSKWIENVRHANTNHNARVVILISGKIDFRVRTIAR